MKVTDSFKHLRHLKHLTQVQLAAKANVSLPTIQNIEAGKANPTLNLLEKIYHTFGVTLEIRSQDPDWSFLKMCGLPLEFTPKKYPKKQVDLTLLASHLNKAIQTLLVSPPNETKQFEESLVAMILAIREHYYSFYRYFLNSRETFKFLQNHEATGRIIKLKRIAASHLAEIL